MVGGSSTKRRCPLLLLANLILSVIVSAASGLPALKVHPSHLHDLVENENRTVQITVSMSKEDMEAASKRGDQWRISARTLHPNVAGASLSDSSDGGSDDDGDEAAAMDVSSPFNATALAYDNSSRLYTMDSTLTVSGKFLGKTGVKVRLVRSDESMWKSKSDWRLSESMEKEEMEEWIIGGDEKTMRDNEKIIDVWVKRGSESERLTRIFVGTLMVLIPLANILMGCGLDMNIVLTTIKRPMGPMIGMATQFLIMPVLAYVIAKSTFIPHGEYSLALGLFVTGCAPGGGASNFWTILLDGNVNLSVTMTFLSTLASLVMMPLWLSLLGSEFLVGFSEGSRIKVPYAKIGSSLLSLVGPLLIGVLIAKFRPKMAVKARKVMRPFIIFVLIFVVAFGALSNLYMFRMITPRALIGGLLLPWCGFMFGCFAAIFTRRSPGDVTAIAIETGIQNTGVAILLLKFSFPAPDSDISSLLPVIVACFTPGPLLMGAAVHMMMKWMQKRSEPEDIEKQPVPLQLVVPTSTAIVCHPSPPPTVILTLPPVDQPTTGLMMETVDVPPTSRAEA